MEMPRNLCFFPSRIVKKPSRFFLEFFRGIFLGLVLVFGPKYLKLGWMCVCACGDENLIKIKIKWLVCGIAKINLGVILNGSSFLVAFLIYLLNKKIEIGVFHKWCHTIYFWIPPSYIHLIFDTFHMESHKSKKSWSLGSIFYKCDIIYG